MYEEEHHLVLTKYAERQLQVKPTEKSLAGLLASVNSRSLEVSGWHTDAEKLGHGNSTGWRMKNLAPDTAWQQFELYGEDTPYRYEMYLTVTYKPRDDKKPDPQVFKSICRTIFTRSAQPQLGRWTLSTVDDEDYQLPDENHIPLGDFIGYADLKIPEEWSSYFDHLYGLDFQIARVLRALQAGEESHWENRFHCVLAGPPGCGKSDICRSIKRALGDEAVMEFDATATTGAGAIKELSEREILPRVLIIEEIEKADDKALDFLLALLDLRSEIRKTTARAKIERETKVFAIATCNDTELFRKLKAGALASRFNNPVFFKRPNREQLSLILHREVTKVHGDFAWINPTLDYCEAKGISDPRMVTAICLCGRELLITGEYQKMLEATSETQLFSERSYVEDSGLVEDWS